MKEKIQQFKEIWNKQYSWISLELSNDEIEQYVTQEGSIFKAVNQAIDFQLANGIGDVQE
jgi:uncharacterized membrane protein